ncbi:MAG: hypothetical protein WAU28_05265 [Candidatus Moraniibacteriota bacterium]
MTKNSEKNLAIFEGAKIRRVWDEERQMWYFSIVDVIRVLTDSPNPTDYLKKLRKRDSELGKYIGTNCPQVALLTETGNSFKKDGPLFFSGKI